VLTAPSSPWPSENRKTLLHRALVAFRIVLGASLLYGSASTAIVGAVRAFSHQTHNPHLILVASVEALGALLLLLPRTRQAGALALLLTIGIAFLVHLARRDLRPDLLVYAAGVVLVAAHDRGLRTGDRAGRGEATT
jgi:uncharacterized membrane protein YphA (DoxX/SURF4 family)